MAAAVELMLWVICALSVAAAIASIRNVAAGLLAERALIQRMRSDRPVTARYFHTPAGARQMDTETMAKGREAVEIALRDLSEGDRRLIREGLDQPSAVGRVRYLQKLLSLVASSSMKAEKQAS